jgi:hypothetical protein
MTDRGVRKDSSSKNRINYHYVVYISTYIIKHHFSKKKALKPS